MERIPQGKCTLKFRLEAVKLVATGISIPEASSRLSIPKSSLHKYGLAQIDKANWLISVKGNGYPASKKWSLPVYGGSSPIYVIRGSLKLVSHIRTARATNSNHLFIKISKPCRRQDYWPPDSSGREPEPVLFQPVVLNNVQQPHKTRAYPRPTEAVLLPDRADFPEK
jgi:hypothetical protein